MRFGIGLLVILMCGHAYATTDGDLSAAIVNARNACGDISDDLTDLKRMAGINTAVTGVGTVAGGVALGTGLAKSGVDSRADKIETELQEEIEKLELLARTQTEISVIPDDIFNVDLSGSISGDTGGVADARDSIAEKQAELDKLTKKSKTLGNIRTGTLATATAADVAGTVIAANNRVKGDLQAQINECRAAIGVLSTVYMSTRVADMENPDLSYAKQIIDACGVWDTVDLSSINSKAKGAAISSGVGAALGLSGTVTSAMANSNSVRNDNTASGKAKEKNLNTASNVLAGGTTVASGVATIFNATQIGAIKRAVAAATECEGAF